MVTRNVCPPVAPLIGFHSCDARAAVSVTVLFTLETNPMKIRLQWTKAGIPVGGEELIITTESNTICMCELDAMVERHRHEVKPPIYVRGAGCLKLVPTVLSED